METACGMVMLLRNWLFATMGRYALGLVSVNPTDASDPALVVMLPSTTMYWFTSGVMLINSTVAPTTRLPATRAAMDPLRIIPRLFVMPSSRTVFSVRMNDPKEGVPVITPNGSAVI